MTKKKACKNCRILTTSNSCPSCGSQDLATSWKGKIFVLDSEKSELAKTINIKKNGEYALKIR